jgi:fructuronate reductase
VHIGLGAFHRAHQGAYTDAALSAGDRDFLITGVSMRQATAANELNPQSGLYTLTERNGEERRTRLIGAVREVLVATEQPDAVVAALADKAVTVVTLTITEKGYARLADGVPPPFCALVLQALEIRRRNGVGGLTLLSCDNLPDNGAVLGALVREGAAARNEDLARWIEAECAFPSSMVDRIVPAVTEADREAVAQALGLRDEAAVLTEPFSQWVIEDRFAARRPRWEAMGAQIVPDVRPFEKAKLRMLNGAHSALAYLGLERGWTYVHEAVADPVLAPVIARLMRIEAARSFAPAPGQNLEAYADALIARFANTALNHRLSQIAMDGSQKIPQRWLETLAVHQARGEPSPALITALAAWVRHVRGDARTVDDPRAAELAELWRTSGEDGVARALFGPSGLFANIWSADETALAALTKAVKGR